MMVALRLIVVFIFSSLISTVGERRPWPETLPWELSLLDISTRIRADPEATTAAGSDFGRIVDAVPAAVFLPSSYLDILALLRLANNSPQPFKVAVRGRGHSVRGQAAAPNGVVVDMSSLRKRFSDDAAPLIRVSSSLGSHGFPYADVGGEQLWIDVLNETLKHGLAPKSWTDYLHLTVGGTLSNAGISGQAFRHGPQISNVYELDVVTGKGERKTCSRELNSDLFYAVLGGLGQFGVITRARIALEQAPERVIWVRMIYNDFAAFTEDQEHLIFMNRTSSSGKTWTTNDGFDYVEGSVFADRSPASSWRSSFFSPAVSARINALIAQYGPVYCLEVGMYYHRASESSTMKDVDRLLEKLSFVPGMAFTKDVSYASFLNRVHEGELKLRSQGLWDVPHPWLNLFLPRSKISEFNSGIFRGILMKNRSKGPILVYPLIRERWDERMSAVIPDEAVFYSVAMLWSAVADDLEQLEDQNARVLQYCRDEGINAVQYLPHYGNKSDWVKHFGDKWEVFLERKRVYDPKMLLSPGQRIFTSSDRNPSKVCESAV